MNRCLFQHHQQKAGKAQRRAEHRANIKRMRSYSSKKRQANILRRERLLGYRLLDSVMLSLEMAESRQSLAEA